MKHYLDLIPISEKVHRRQSRMTRACIFLAVFLVTVIFSMADMQIRTEKNQAIQSDGKWHACFAGLTEEEGQLLSARPKIQEISWYGVTNYGLDMGYTVSGTQTVLCGFDKSFLELFPVAKTTQGTYPVKDNEVIATESLKDQLGIQIGDTLSLKTPDRVLTLTVCGFTKNTSMLTKHDAFGLFFNTSGYQKFFSEDTLASDSVYYVQFTPYCNIQKEISEIQTQFGLYEKQITQNTKLLAMMFQSNDSYMLQLYLTAAVLAFLVMVAGILMITSSLNSNISQRIEFFGLMRCLGATSKQIRRFVIREALCWCKTAVFLGLTASILVTWGLCAMLRFLSPGLFLQMPAFSVSWASLILGLSIGLITVLLAAISPAKKASRVSPLTAVSGNTHAFAQPSNKSASTRLFSVEIALGIHHAAGSKKNLILMAGSFAFSIILFLAFSPAVSFLNHAFNPLKPYAPDLTISSDDSSLTISKNLASQIAEHPAVKRVYGRSISSNLTVRTKGKDLAVNLVSYEEHQLQWAKDALLEGETKQPKVERSLIFTVYSQDNPLTLHSTFSVNADSSKEFSVDGVVSSYPFHSMDGTPTIICSEPLFLELTGKNGYSVIDVQLKKEASDEDVQELRTLLPEGVSFSDLRLSNQETTGAFYSCALFIYGFLVVIALISVFNIVNSIALSVTSRIQQYGSMRAIGMSSRQLSKMVAAEAMTYGFCGILAGCAAGLPLNRFLFQRLVSFRWGDAWTLPVFALLVILSVVLLSVLLSILGPTRRIRNLVIVDTINDL